MLAVKASKVKTLKNPKKLKLSEFAHFILPRTEIFHEKYKYTNLSEIFSNT